MSDPDTPPDPIDQAYARAESVLSDDAERAARRARVLASVAQAPASPSAASPRLWRPSLRQGGQLAAAGVAGLCVIAATQLYPLTPRERRTESTRPRPEASASAPPERPSAPTPPAFAPPTVGAFRAPPQAASMARSPAISEDPAHAPSAPPAEVAERGGASPAPAPPPPVSAPVVASRRNAPAPAPGLGEAAVPSARDDAVDGRSSAEMAAKSSPAPALEAGSGAARRSGAQSLAGSVSDQAARLRAAAAAGRTADVESLLDQGAPVDAPDGDGETALMKSIKAGHPATAALLRRRGAGLDIENHAGQSARDMARARNDAAMDQALGLRR